MKNPMLKFIMKGKKEDMVHTSVYAEAQNSGGIGVSSTRSFADRMKIERNRKRVRGYRDAKVVSEQGREAWRIRQEARQMGEEGSAGNVSIGSASDSASGDSSMVSKQNANSRGGIKANVPTVKNPGISRKI